MEVAKLYYRDVLVLAETPESFRMSQCPEAVSYEESSKALEAEQAVEDKEYEEYLKWLQQSLKHANGVRLMK